MQLVGDKKKEFARQTVRPYLSKEKGESADVEASSEVLMKMYEVRGHMRSNSLRETVKDFTMGNILYSQSERETVVERFRASYDDPVEVHSVIKAKRFVPSDPRYYIEFSDKTHFHNKVKFAMQVVSKPTEEVSLSLDLSSYDSDLDPDYEDDDALLYDIADYNDAQFVRQVNKVLGDMTLEWRSEKNDLRNVYAYYLLLMKPLNLPLLATLLDDSISDEDVEITNFFSDDLILEVQEWKGLKYKKAKQSVSLFNNDTDLCRNLSSFEWGDRAREALERVDISIYLIRAGISEKVQYFLISINKGKVNKIVV